MELGNLVFGNSRGEYEVDRNLQDQWCGWMERLGFSSYGHKEGGDGWVFENDTFRMQPYYWGDCTCGYDDLEWEWCEANSICKHRHDCYQIEYKSIIDQHGYPWRENGVAARLVSELCDRHGLSYPEFSAVHCTCDYGDRWEVFSSQNGHKDDCPVVTPNFLFKPSGFRLDWYKYPLRDSYSSEPLTAELIDRMFAECERSMG